MALADEVHARLPESLDTPCPAIYVATLIELAARERESVTLPRSASISALRRRRFAKRIQVRKSTPTLSSGSGKASSQV